MLTRDPAAEVVHARIALSVQPEVSHLLFIKVPLLPGRLPSLFPSPPVRDRVKDHEDLMKLEGHSRPTLPRTVQLTVQLRHLGAVSPRRLLRVPIRSSPPGALLAARLLVFETDSRAFIFMVHNSAILPRKVPVRIVRLDRTTMDQGTVLLALAHEVPASMDHDLRVPCAGRWHRGSYDPKALRAGQWAAEGVQSLPDHGLWEIINVALKALAQGLGEITSSDQKAPDVCLGAMVLTLNSFLLEWVPDPDRARFLAHRLIPPSPLVHSPIQWPSLAPRSMLPLSSQRR